VLVILAGCESHALLRLHEVLVGPQPVDVMLLRVEMCELACTDVDQCRNMVNRRQVLAHSFAV
jgi:hypothetical protein